MIYFDFNSTAPYSEKVAKYLRNEMDKDWLNASSEYQPSFELSSRIKSSRQIIADYLNCSTAKLIFNSGATESINTVLSAQNLSNFKSIITSKLEHHATLESCNANNFPVHFVDNDSFGNINLQNLEELCANNRKSLVSLLFVNNETGVISPVDKIVEIAHKYECKVHIDAVQGLGKLEIDLEGLEVDFASFSGHKIGSLKGIGLLYVKNPNEFVPLIIGGGQERKLRAGTYNFAGIQSLSLAVQDISIDENDRIGELRESFERSFLEIDRNYRINGLDAPRVHNTSSIYLGGRPSHEALMQLSSKGILTSTGSACNSGSFKPSHVITSMESKEIAQSTLRISFGTLNTESDVEFLLKSIKELF